MQHPPVLALGYSEAAMLLRRPDAHIGAIIAIHGQREHAVEYEPAHHRLVLRFDDCEAPSTTDPLQADRVRIRQREAEAVGLKLTPPNPDDARTIVEFARSIQSMDGMLMCHCGAGVSRSPAAALICLATWTGPGQERYCAEHLMSFRSCAVPHADLVAFGDRLLSRNGALIEAMNRVCSGP